MNLTTNGLEDIRGSISLIGGGDGLIIRDTDITSGSVPTEVVSSSVTRTAPSIDVGVTGTYKLAIYSRNNNTHSAYVNLPSSGTYIWASGRLEGVLRNTSTTSGGTRVISGTFSSDKYFTARLVYYRVS